MRFKPEKGRLETKVSRREKRLEERFQYASQLGTAVEHRNAFESLIVLRKHIFLLLPILRRRALVSL